MATVLTFSGWGFALAAKAGNKRSFILICIVLCTLQVQRAVATDLVGSFSLTHVNSDAGLPQNSVRAIQVDHDGFLWVGTEKGLSRFDGNSFINFSEIVPGIPQDVSLGLYLDSQNRLWTNWYKHSLRVLSADRNRVISIDPAEGFPNDMQALGTLKIVELGNGDIWFPGVENIYRLNPENKVTSVRIDSPISTKGVEIGHQLAFGTEYGLLLIDVATEEIQYLNVAPQEGSSIPQALNTTLVTKYDGYLIFCHTNGIFSYKPQTAELSQISTETGYGVSYCKQLESNLLVSLFKPGLDYVKLVTLDIKSRKLIPNQNGLPESTSTRNGVGLHDTFVDNNKNYWVLLGDVLLLSDGMGSDFQPLELPVKPFGSEDVFAQSDSGVVWLRTDGNGLAKFSRHSRRFQTTIPPSIASASSRIRSMAVDRDNNVWVINDERNLLYWDRSQDVWIDRLPGNIETIKGLEILPDGTVWIALPTLNKILGFNPKTNAWEYEHKTPGYFAVISQTPDKQLLVASRRYAVKVEPKTGWIEYLTKEPLRGQIRVLEQDQTGNVWVGTHEAGLIRIDPSGHVKSWTKENSGLSSDEIFSLHFDAHGQLWIGTWHGGLLSFNPATNRFTHYGQAEGLPDATVFGILEDDDGYLWLSTYAGLTRFIPCVGGENCRPEIIVFNRHDGLQGNEFDADSYFKSDQGELFFAGGGGLNAFYPSDILINQRPPKVAISRASLNGEPMPGANSEFAFPESVRLPFEFGELRLEVAVLDFNSPAKNRLQYRDLADGNSWQEMQQPFLSVRGLNDGPHTFQFRGANNDGVWSAQHAGIKLTVAPPLYRSSLTLVLYLLLMILLPALYFRIRQARLIEQQRYLKGEVAKRTRELELANSSRERFFANISHEICSPVHMILLMLEDHMNKAPAEEKSLYKSATGYAAQLMVYLRQLVSEARSHEVDSHLYAVQLGRIIETLVSTNQPIAKARSVNLKVGRLPAERVALYSSSAISIFSNLLCNALVYTPEGGEVRITGEVTDALYCLAISNTVSDEQATDIGRFFDRGVRGSFHANYFGGHGLGLSIVNSAVEILGGRIDVELKDRHNIVFTIELPLADTSMPELSTEGDLAFSHEQMLAIRLVNETEEWQFGNEKPLNALSILMIEDDVQIAHLLSQALSNEYTVYVAGSCQDGLRQVRKYHPDVILCDLFLPDQSGFDVLKAIRANRMTMDTFFVMVTASISEEDRLKCQELGVDRFVRKPVSAETLKLLIRNHFELAEQRIDHLHQEKLIRKAQTDRVQGAGRLFESRFIEVLEELYQDPGTSIENIQTRMSMSYTTLMNNCKKTFGKPPKRLLIEKRIEVAKGLLVSSEYKIGLVSELAGFSTHSQFAIVFKKETGTTPAAFRKSS